MELCADWQPGMTLAEGLQVLWKRDVSTDVTFTFIAGADVVKAHRVVLMARSQVFYETLAAAQKSDCSIEIDDVAPGVFRELIKFLYSDTAEVTTENAVHLLHCAQKYKVRSLQTKCLLFLQNHIDEKTAPRILDQAILYEDCKLKAACLECISNCESLEALRTYHVSKQTLEAIIDSESLAVSEITLFKACTDWARMECVKHKLQASKENKRKILGSILKKIRYHRMSSRDFASEVSGRGLLTPQEELEVFRFLSDPPTMSTSLPTSEKTAVIAKLPADMIGRFDASNPGYQIYIISDKEFSLLGFVFSQEGAFTIRMNDDLCEEFVISEQEVGTIVHLEEPVPCDSKKGMDIRNQKNRYAFRDKRAKTYNFSTKIDRDDVSMVTIWFKPYVSSPPPFDTLIFAM